MDTLDLLDSKTILLGQIHKLHIAVEYEYKLFWWKPWVDAHVMREKFWQDYCNYYWHCSVGWLWWSAEIHWQKTRWGWNQISRAQGAPLIWFSWKSDS